jgi:sulfhydrogenase subunit beta (sulfur reductase)
MDAESDRRDEAPRVVERLPRDRLGRLFDALHEAGYAIVAPTVRDGAIVYDEIRAPTELPVGWTDEQGPGRYRLRARGDDRAFGFATGPHSWKQFLFPSRERVLESKTVRDEQAGVATVEWHRPVPEERPRAYLGVRACELAAIAVQDRVFLQRTAGGAGAPAFVETGYARRRSRDLIVALECAEAGDLCFCASMATGPEVPREAADSPAGFDLCLVELPDGFLVEAGSERGRRIVDALADATAPASRADLRLAEQQVAACRAGMGRRLDTDGLPELLMGNLEHAAWDDVAARCLSCANCTSVCPTCFCSTVDEVPDLDPSVSARERVWDSCFSAGHSRVHGGEFRPEVGQRYRQWLTHKLATWHGQFGTSGCVGCGRCIAWCPTGIDLTEEVAALRVGAEPGHPIERPEVVAARPGEPRPDRSSGDPLVPVAASVLAVERETHDVVTLTLAAPEGYEDRPGQFNMLSLPGIGEAPISVADRAEGRILHTIRAVGALTRALCEVRVGDTVGLRGPFGRGWPLAEARGREVVLIAGGIGIAPLRGALSALIRQGGTRAAVPRLVYGARSPRDLVFDEELLRWQSSGAARISVTVDRSAAEWTGNVGTVLTLLERKPVESSALYWLCGPEIMLKLCVEFLTRRGVSRENVFVSMERNMRCAAGFCGRCQYGPHFVCKDGPVFRFDRVAHLFGRKGI